MKFSSIVFGALCLVSTVMVLGAEAAPKKPRQEGRHIKRTRKELRQALHAKRLLTRRSWYGAVAGDDDCTTKGMIEQGLELQTESRPFGLCEKVRKCSFSINYLKVGKFSETIFICKVFWIP